MDVVSLAVGHGISSIADALLQAMSVEWKRRASLCIRLAEQYSGLTREDIAETLETEPHLLTLTNRVLYAAGMRGSDEVLLGLSAVLGDTLREPSKADEAEVYVSILEKLTDPHIELLRYAYTLSQETPRSCFTSLTNNSGLPPAIARVCLNDLVQGDLMAEARLHAQTYSTLRTPMFAVTPTGELVRGVSLKSRGLTPVDRTTLRRHPHERSDD